MFNRTVTPPPPHVGDGDFGEFSCLWCLLWTLVTAVTAGVFSACPGH